MLKTLQKEAEEMVYKLKYAEKMFKAVGDKIDNLVVQYGSTQQMFAINEKDGTETPAKLRDVACRYFNLSTKDAKGKHLYHNNTKITTGTRAQFNNDSMVKIDPTLREKSILVLL